MCKVHFWVCFFAIQTAKIVLQILSFEWAASEHREFGGFYSFAFHALRRKSVPPYSEKICWKWQENGKTWNLHEMTHFLVSPKVENKLHFLQIPSKRLFLLFKKNRDWQFIIYNSCFAIPEFANPDFGINDLQLRAVLMITIIIYWFVHLCIMKRGYSAVVARSLCMWKAPGSIPGTSKSWNFFVFNLAEILSSWIHN
jgi:hypothetical protein